MCVRMGTKYGWLYKERESLNCHFKATKVALVTMKIGNKVQKDNLAYM